MICCPLSSAEDGDGAMEASTVAHPTARKAHRCCECGETIAPKTKYERVTGVWDGTADTFKTCLSCVEIRDHFACGRGYLFGELWTDLEDNFFPDMKVGGPCMEGLSPAAKQRLFDRRMTWLEETSE